MERMIIFCMLFFCFSMVLTATSPKAMKYKQLSKTIDHLKDVVKDKDVELLHTPENPGDGCLLTAVTCFQNGILKLQPRNSQVNATFAKTVKILRRPFLPVSEEHCESSCESYERKKPQEFLNSFSKLMQKLFKNSTAERYGKSTI
ncbi:interleukin-21 precursor [Gallus gallus]|uniref:Interleukin n=1 Tax=Gallus gallus TaxID=9031 RepID=D3GGX2_CHICK|nr:interleukin-21 precursor [Gallus gallus]ACY72344.1 interleukin-21 precursor [Gallus gallus]